MAGAAFGDPGLYAALFERLAVLSAVIGTVSEQRPGPELPVAASRWDAVDERDQLGDVVAVAGSERHGQGDALAVADHVVLGACPAAVERLGRNPAWGLGSRDDAGAGGCVLIGSICGRFGAIVAGLPFRCARNAG